jgi:acyl-CoA synthetase (AMP-forming)/AMP-acid ligase II/outer membrane protein assembly factor BamB
MTDGDDDDEIDDDHCNEDLDGAPATTIVEAFDMLCFEFGDQDAILLDDDSLPSSAPIADDSPSTDSSATCYFEIQEYSKTLAYQLYWRFRPDYVLVDCQGWPAAEAVATLACMRIGRPFVPVSAFDQHRPGRMDAAVTLLQEKGKSSSMITTTASDRTVDHSRHSHPAIVAVTVCRNDRDPILSVFQQAGVHQILFLDRQGMIQEQLQVPDSLPAPTIPTPTIDTDPFRDDIYVLFTSGTSTARPKAVVGSHRATFSRIQWFRKEFSPSPRIGRRTKLTFVDGVTELWGALLDPSSVLVAVAPSHLQAKGIAALLEKGCTQLLLLPSQLSQLLLLHHPKSSSSSATLSSPVSSSPFPLDRVIVSGEACTTSMLTKFRQQYPTTQLINLYGQTESTGDCLYAVLTDLGEKAVVDNVVAVGRPICGTEVSIFVGNGNDPENQLLQIKGSQLSNGYLGGGSDDDTDKSTIQFDSFVPGDVGFCQDGIWYVRGRVDDVRKVNGVWTSPSEVEAAFCNIYGVDEAVAVILEDPTNANRNQVYVLCDNEKIVLSFSRLAMHEAGIPWNLIPTQTFLHAIPRNSSGAGKVDRQASTKIAREASAIELIGGDPTLNGLSDRKSIKNIFLSIVSDTLGIEASHLDGSKSFVELGGDSASSISFLYRLKQEATFSNSRLNATDILWAQDIWEIYDILSGKSSRKKQKLQSSDASFSSTKYSVPTTAFAVNDQHQSIQMVACVDSTPLVVEETIYAACQGGSILKFNRDGNVEGSCHHPTWMFQADILCLIECNGLIVCGHNLTNDGLVLCLSNDLKEEQWRLEIPSGPIRSSPVHHDGRLWVLAGSTVLCLNTSNGHKIGPEVLLPRTCVTAPVLMRKGDNISIAFASSDWEGGLMVLDPNQGKIAICADCEIGPVHKNMTLADDCSGQLHISDMYGCLHTLDISTMQVCSLQLSSSPLTSATMLNKTNLVVGSNDGHLYGVQSNNEGLAEQWKFDCMSVVYSRPIQLDDGSIVVCTTAGGIINVLPPSLQASLDGAGDPATLRTAYRIPAEIWSSPAQLRGTTNTIVLGARDSKCHIVTL